MMKEKISQLLDSELSENELNVVLRKVGDDEELAGLWHRYHVISAAMKNELGVVLDPGLARRVVGAVDQEVRPRSAGRAWMQIGGLALAATVAGVAILARQPSVDPQAPVRVVSAPPMAAETGTHWQTSSPEVASALNAYLVEHGEYAANRGLSGMSPYAHFVSYETGR